MGSSISHNQEILEELGDSACQALFADYGLLIDQALDCAARSSVSFCGIIGFTGDQMRGTLLLAMGAEAIAATVPDGSDTGDDANRNWISELTNQLLGRVKNLLLRRDSDIYLTMPLVLRGEHLSPLPRKNCTGLCFHSPAGEIRLWIDAEFADDFVIATEDSEDSVDLPIEGDAMLF